MKNSNVDLKWKVLSDIHTGMAYIYVNAEGDNSIVIYGGANMAFGNNELDTQFKKAIDQCQYLLLQKEIPMEVNTAAAKYAYSQGLYLTLQTRNNLNTYKFLTYIKC